MAFVNLPPNFQDMFYALSDRIAKLETGPNQAMYTAEAAQGSSAQAITIALSAQSTATQAQVQAINAGIQANNAASQATIAQSQATIASSQATAAQVTANGKNKVYYSTSGPGSTANTVGDIWYQYGTSGTYANKVIAQFSGAGGTSWTSVTVSGLVIANIDAGSITTGTLNAITIAAGSGGNAFNVSSSGVMSAQGAWIKGNITADSGTFNGTINAGTGYFGSLAGGNYWSIGASGLTGVGSAVITGGLIQGSSITVPNSTAWKFAVDSAGSLQAVNANITGTINASAGTIGGFTIGSTSIYSGTNLVIESTGNISGGNSQTLFYGYANIGGGSVTGERLIVAGTSALNGNTGVLGNLSVTNSATFGAITQQFEFLSSTGNVRVASTYGNSVSGRSMQISSSGLYGTTASTLRKKHDIESYRINSSALLGLDVKTFKYKPEIDPDQTVQYGFIAEDAEGLGLNELIQYDSTGIPDYFAYEKLPIFLLQLVQEQDARLKVLEGN
jgi:trimeric autotransporter adhesin